MLAEGKQQQPFGFVFLCRRKQGHEEKRRPCLEGYCCSIRMGKGCASVPKTQHPAPAPRMTTGAGKTKPGVFSWCFPAPCYIPRAALGSGLGQAAPWGSTPGLVQPGLVQPSLASSPDWQPQICTPHLLKPALVQSPAQGSEGIPRMPRSIWSACPPGDEQPDLGHAASPPPPLPRCIFLGCISAI